MVWEIEEWNADARRRRVRKEDMVSKEKYFQAWINPLAFLEVDQPWAQLAKDPVSIEAIINYICTPGLKTDIDSLVARYKEISVEPTRLVAAPAEDRILTKLVWPLRHAKACYVAGNYLGTISLCGMVAEMVAILLFKISDITINGHKITRDDEIKLFGSEFEKLGQERRVDVLRTYNLIDELTENNLDLIRTKRRRYLHIYSQDHANLAPDAVGVFKAAVAVVTEIIGQDVHDGKIVLNPAIVKYLERDALPETE